LFADTGDGHACVPKRLFLRIILLETALRRAGTVTFFKKKGGRSMEWLKSLGSLIGRILLVLIFLSSGVEKIGNFGGTAQYMVKYGIPMTSFFLFGAIMLEMVGSITVILGCWARFGTLLLIIFLIPTTIIFHTDFKDPNQIIHFMKNVSMLGGCFILFGMGAGRFSLDYLLRGGKRRG
jgi:putative oxidoreductase